MEGGWFWVVGGWFWVVTGGYVRGRFRVVTSGFGCLWGGNSWFWLVTSSYEWLWVVMGWLRVVILGPRLGNTWEILGKDLNKT